jgi:hypothetical protein
MKLVSVALFALLAACKPDPVAKPAEGSAAPAPSQPAARAPGPRPTLPPAPTEATDVPAGSAAVAPKRPWLDKDGDGVVTKDERDAARAERMKRVMDRFDANHDGKLTPDELAAAVGSGHHGPHFDDPAALDTNHDGEISADELQEGMRAQRMRGRLRDRSGSGE